MNDLIPTEEAAREIRKMPHGNMLNPYLLKKRIDKAYKPTLIRLRDICTASLTIKDLWLQNKVEPEHKEEAQALAQMHRDLTQARIMLDKMIAKAIEREIE